MTYDLTMIGAGLVGLATARELHRRFPALRIGVLDKEKAVGQHQSSHNSGVLHSGVYYQPGSSKARLCVRGRTLMERFAEEHGIPHQQCGKVIVALHEGELGRLAELESRGTANGVAGITMIGPERLRELEPHVSGIRALQVPATGIIDFSLVVTALAAELINDGVDILLGQQVQSIRRRGRVQLLSTAAGVIETRRVISCAGLQADRVARYTAEPEVRIVPFRGDYYTLKLSARPLCENLIYPVPDPALPFLGVHLTRRTDGEVWAGPNAVLATAREGYRRTDLDLRDLTETVRFRGFRKLARAHWRTGAREIWRDLAKRAFAAELQRYLPEIVPGDLAFGPSGVRAQAVAPNGAMVDDFLLVEGADSLHVVNAPSPAATASLAIGHWLADRSAKSFALDC